ncbi:MAG: T9SS type A sorting domain-containing protein, partial [FCB group bacterium]
HVTGTGVGNDVSPKFTVNISNLDFGTVFIGTTKQKSVIVTNTGATNLIISNIISSDDHYIITPVIGTITPGSSLEFFITFAPLVVGQVNANILFTHNVGANTITVTGNGVSNNSVITIKAARELPLGTPFSIEGIVTRTLGSYTRIQDTTGAITIVQATGAFWVEVGNSSIQMEDLVRVQGSISEINSLKVINGSDLTGYQRLSRLNLLPTPVKVTLSEIASNGEQYESRLITLDKLTITGGSDITFQPAKTYQVTDASDNSNKVVVRIGNSEDTYMDGMPFIGTSVTFLGVLSQSSMSDPSIGYQLTPVLPNDLIHSPTGVSDLVNANQSSLSDNYPNPFNTSTTIQYSLGNAGFVSLKVFDVLGVEVTTLVNRFQEAGSYTVPFSVINNNLSLGSCIYFYRLEVGTFVSTKRMILLK